MFEYLIAFLLVLLTIYIWKIWSSYGFFKNQGISGPKPRFFYGNFYDIYKNKNYSDALQEWTKKYGKTYGFFEGHLPILVTSDLDLIQEICIKQSTNFAAKKRFLLTDSDDGPTVSLLTATKSRWKRMRQIINPTFSSSKLREISPTLLKCSDRLMNICRDNENKTINISDAYKRFTMDSIWNCAFGVDIDIQNTKGPNKYFDNSIAVFKMSESENIFRFLGAFLHDVEEKLFGVLVVLNRVITMMFDNNKFTPGFWILENVSSIVEARKNSNEKKKDYVQLLIDSETERITEANDSIADYTANYLEKTHIRSGYETTSTALSYSTYILAKYQDQQQKLYDEISSVFRLEDSETGKITSDSVQSIEYLDMFIKECLRCYPIANPVITRRCTNPTTVNGINFTLNEVIAFDVLSVHYDPELWGPVDPKLFYPERFSKDIKRNPLAFMGFGIGPRNCIGMKFALIELKIALCKLLLEFEVLPSDEMPKELELTEGIVRVPKNDLKVVLKKRN